MRYGMFIVYNMCFILLLMFWIVKESSPCIKGKGNLLTQRYNLRNLIIFDIIGIKVII